MSLTVTQFDGTAKIAEPSPAEPLVKRIAGWLGAAALVVAAIIAFCAVMFGIVWLGYQTGKLPTFAPFGLALIAFIIGAFAFWGVAVEALDEEWHKVLGIALTVACFMYCGATLLSAIITSDGALSRLF